MMPSMPRATSPLAGRLTRSGSRAIPRVGWASLGAMAVVLAHELSWAFGAGPGDRIGDAGRPVGDGWWLAVSAAALGAVITMLVMSVAQARRLRREACIGPVVDPDGAVRTLLGSTLRIWWRLSLIAVMLLVSQENTEAIASGLAPPGLETVVVSQPLGLLAIAGLALLMAFVAALLHLRRIVLLGRPRVSAASWPRRPSIRRPTEAVRVRALIDPLLRVPVRAPPVHP